MYGYYVYDIIDPFYTFLHPKSVAQAFITTRTTVSTAWGAQNYISNTRRFCRSEAWCMDVAVVTDKRGEMFCPTIIVDSPFVWVTTCFCTHIIIQSIIILHTYVNTYIHYNKLHHSTLHCSALHYSILQYVSYRFVASLHYITLQYEITNIQTYTHTHMALKKYHVFAWHVQKYVNGGGPPLIAKASTCLFWWVIDRFEFLQYSIEGVTWHKNQARSTLGSCPLSTSWPPPRACPVILCGDFNINLRNGAEAVFIEDIFGILFWDSRLSGLRDILRDINDQVKSPVKEWFLWRGMRHMLYKVSELENILCFFATTQCPTGRNISSKVPRLHYFRFAWKKSTNLEVVETYETPHWHHVSVVLRVKFDITIELETKSRMSKLYGIVTFVTWFNNV